MIGDLVPTRLDQRDGKMFALHEISGGIGGDILSRVISFSWEKACLLHCARRVMDCHIPVLFD